jgi:hypothetical protein
VSFHNKFIFYGEGLLAPRPTPKLEDHLSFVRGCLFYLNYIPDQNCSQQFLV